MQERVIMKYCVDKAGTSRKHFIHSFPGNETNLEWLKTYRKTIPTNKELNLLAKEIKRAQNTLIELEESSHLSIAEIKEINRRLSFGEAKVTSRQKRND